MGKLYELLAVEPELRQTAEEVSKSIQGLLSNAAQQLVGQVRTYQPLDEEGEGFAPEVTNMGTTVSKALARLEEGFGPWLDLAIAKENANRGAAANVLLDGEVILFDIGATALLNLEAKLEAIRRVYKAIPTNDPSERWTWDSQNECWVSQPRITYKTQKVPEAHVDYEATKEHPAQVTAYNRDVRIGEWTTTISSGMLSPSDKRERLARLDKLIAAVKTARQRANSSEADQPAIAADLFAYINEGRISADRSDSDQP
jgi:hypothetical protein